MTSKPLHKLIYVLVAFVGCSTTQVDVPLHHGTISDLDSALDAWAQAEPDSYQYTMIYIDGSGCATHKFLTLVKNGRTESSSNLPVAASCSHVESGVDAGEGRGEPHLVAGMTITHLLTRIVQIDCPLRRAHSPDIRCPRDGALFEAQYHPQYGFPISFHYSYGAFLDERFGYILEGQQIKYDFGYQITKFQILE